MIDKPESSPGGGDDLTNLAVRTDRFSRGQRLFHRWLVPALVDWLIIVAAMAVGFWVNHLAFWFVVTLVVGNRQHALGILGHDAAHSAATDNKALNDLAAEILCFWPILTGLADFRAFHFKHHRYFNTDKDPELLFKTQWSRAQWSLPKSRAKIFSYFFLDLFGFGALEVAKGFYMLEKIKLRSWLGPLVWWTVMGFVLYTTQLWLAAGIWFAALLTSFWGFHRLRTWIEHVGTDSTHRVRANWWQRIVITPHGSWSHYEHHDHPAVPYWSRHELRPASAPTVSMGELFASFGENA